MAWFRNSIQYAVLGFKRNASEWWLAVIGGIVAWLFLVMTGQSKVLDVFLPANAFLANSIVVLICVALGELTVFTLRFAYAPIYFALKPRGGLRGLVKGHLGARMLFLTVGALGFLAIGVAIGGLLAHRPRAAAEEIHAQTAGRIAWSFDAPGDSFFLVLNSFNGQELRVIGFHAHGKNTSNDPISEFSGYIRSDLTNARRPILIAAQEANPDPRVPTFFRPLIPTEPEETYGIPALAEFDIVTFDKPMVQLGVDGETVSHFLGDFGPFTLVLTYDGKTTERHFSLEQIKAQIAMLEKQTHPELGSLPRVMRKPTAKPAIYPPLPLPPALPPPPNQEQHTDAK